MKKVLVLLSLSILMMTNLQSCKENKEAKQITEAKEQADVTVGAVPYNINAAESEIEWEGKTITGKHSGEIRFKTGELSIKDGIVESGVLVADMNTLKSGDLLKEAPEKAAKLDEHLKNEDFFDVVKYPEAKFTITSVKTTEGEYNILLEGNLELKGISKNLTVKAKTEVEGNKFKLKTEKFTINRQDFKITYTNGAPQDKVINDLFDLEVKVEAEKK